MTRTSFYRVLTAVSAVCLATLLPPAVLAATFEVMNGGDSGPGTLRQAILDANASPGSDTITFDLPGSAPHFIQPLSALPSITDEVDVDGRTQPGYAEAPIVVVDGSLAGANVDGLHVNAETGVTIRSLVISRWSRHGIHLDGRGIPVSFDIHVFGCYIGTDPTGVSAWPNGGDGIRATDSLDHVIGGSPPGFRNVVSGNLGSGMRFASSGGFITNHILQGNWIGVDSTGTQPLGNGASNVVFENCINCEAGGQGGGRGNVIAASQSGYGVVFLGGNQNWVFDSHIGIDPSGSTAMPNALGGIFFSDNREFLVEGNVISGHAAPGAAGVVVEGVGSSPSINTFMDNRIGTDAAGEVAVPNSIGLWFRAGGAGVVGGLASGDRNVISGNLEAGIVFEGSSTEERRIQSNLIGLSASGQPLGNGGSGVLVDHADVLELTGSLIGANGGYGVEVRGDGSRIREIDQNFIGTDSTGGAGLGNLLGGIVLDGGAMSDIGLPGQGNVISGNGDGGAGDGVRVEGTAAIGNLIRANLIGLKPNGVDPLPNEGSGVRITGDASMNQIGGAAAGEPNTIAFNGGSGVAVESGTANWVSANSLADNGGLGLDLGAVGVNPNDAGDGDGGANQGQNFPVLTAVTADPQATLVEGTLSSAPSTRYLVEVFVGPSCDPSSHGEGEALLATAAVDTDGSGVGSFFTLAPVIPVGHSVAATATDPLGNTSEFSLCAEAVAGSCDFCILLDGFETGDTSRWSAALGM